MKSEFFYKGFYLLGDIEKELSEIKLEKFIDIGDVDLSECPYDDANVFLHGSCQLFADKLSRTFNYEKYQLVDDKERMIHVFCMLKKNSEIYYIDVRGITTDKVEFLSEFLKGTIEKYNDPIDFNEEWLMYGLKFAEDIIEKHKEFYQI